MAFLNSPIGKITMVAKLISDKFDLVAEGDGVSIVSKNFKPLSNEEVISIVSKLAQDYNMINIEQDWKFAEAIDDKDKSSFICVVSKKKDFEKGLYELRDKLKEESPELINKHEDEKALGLFYSKEGHLVLNDVFLLHKTKAESQYDRVLRYLFKYPNRTITRETMFKHNILSKEDKETTDFYIMLRDIKVFGDLRELFFPKEHLSNDSIHLKNPILFKDLSDKELRFVNLGKFLKPK